MELLSALQVLGARLYVPAACRGPACRTKPPLGYVWLYLKMKVGLYTLRGAASPATVAVCAVALTVSESMAAKAML
jgi:hypothetical protein